MSKMEDIKFVSQLIEILEKLRNQYGDLEVVIDLKDDTLNIHSVNYTTTVDHKEYIALNNFN
jgi:hypothetical protein